MKYYKLIKPLLFLLKPEVAHSVALKSMRFLHRCHLSFLFSHQMTPDPTTVMGLSFPNKMGLAAGFDKNGDYIDTLAKLGFGFLEVGAVTPKPQPGNPKPRLFRLKKSKALINRMGFNNKGVDYLVERLKKRKSNIIVGVNIGKNATTPMDRAVDDYVICMEKLYPHVDFITANISSPNTKNIRNLQEGEALGLLLKALKQLQMQLHQKYGKYVPLLVKVAPDIASDQIHHLAGAFLQHNIDGMIATNAAFFRDGCEHEKYKNEKGGLSGTPIFHRVNDIIAEFKQCLKDEIPIIGLGGILSKADAQKHLAAGASLLQVYTGLIYQGPGVLDYGMS